MWSNGAIVRRRIDDLWFSARIVERGDDEEVICKIEYLDDHKTEKYVPLSECDQPNHEVSGDAGQDNLGEECDMRDAQGLDEPENSNTKVIEMNSNESCFKPWVSPEKVESQQETDLKLDKDEPVAISTSQIQDATSQPVRTDSTPQDRPLMNGDSDRLIHRIEDREKTESPPPDKNNGLPIEGVCEICGVMTPYRCARCGVAFFCSREHQREAWGPPSVNKTDDDEDDLNNMDIEKGEEEEVNDDNVDPKDNIKNKMMTKGYHRSNCIQLVSGPIKAILASSLGQKVQSKIDDFIGPSLPLVSNVDGSSLKLNLNNKRFCHDDGSGGNLGSDADLVARAEKQFGHLLNAPSSSSSSSSLCASASAATASNHGDSRLSDALASSSHGGRSYDDINLNKKSTAAFSDFCQDVSQSFKTSNLNGPPTKKSNQNDLDHYLGMMSKRENTHDGGEPVSVGSPPGTPPSVAAASNKSNLNFVNSEFMEAAFTTPPRMKRRANDDQDIPRTAPNIMGGYGGDDERENHVMNSFPNISEANVASLMEMGIVSNEADAREALGHSQDSVEQAIEWVFSGGLRQIQSTVSPNIRPMHSDAYTSALVHPDPLEKSTSSRSSASAAAHGAPIGTTPYLDASMLAVHTQEASMGQELYNPHKLDDDGLAVSDDDKDSVGGGIDRRDLKEIHSLLHGSGGVRNDLPPLDLSQVNFPPLPPPGRTTSPEDIDPNQVRIDSFDDLITSFEVNVTRGIIHGPPWHIKLNATAYRVNHLKTQQDGQDSSSTHDLLLILSEVELPLPVMAQNLATCTAGAEEDNSSYNGSCRFAMIVAGTDVITISRTTFPARTEAPLNWMDRSNDALRAIEFGSYIDALQKPGDDSRYPSNQYVIKIPTSQRVVTQSASCDIADDPLECYKKALPVQEAAQFLGSFGSDADNGGRGLCNLGGGTGGIGSVGITSRLEPTYTVKNYNDSLNAGSELIVDELKVSQLEDMGFDSGMAREALKSNRNDIDAAANHIISLMYA